MVGSFRILMGILAAGLAVAGPARGELKIGERTTLAFATVQEGGRVLASRDDYVQRLSPFDLAAKMKTAREVTKDDYRKFARTSVLPWEDEEKKRVSAAYLGIEESLEALDLSFPEKVLVIKTSGEEEGGAAYTRGNAIVLPKNALKRSPGQLQHILCHELFHVLSRANPELREKLYESIGFVKCNELDPLPGGLEARRITNPDAPRNDHCIRLEVDGEERWAIPVIYSKSAKYDAQEGGAFFQYLRFSLLMVDRDAESGKVTPVLAGKEPVLEGVEDVDGFFEQVGRNTGYIIHPEEILADNFSALVLKREELPSPKVVEKMKTILAASKPGKE